MDFSDIVITLINAGLSIYLVAFFFKTFSVTKFSKCNTLISYIAATIAMALVITFASNLIVKMMSIIGISLLLSLIYKIQWFNRVVLSFIIYAISGAVEFLTVVLVSVLFSVGVEEYNFGWLYVLGIFLSKIAIFIVLSLIRIQKHRILHDRYHKKYLSVCFIPVSTFAVFLIMYRYYISSITIVKKPDWVDLLCCLLLVVANIVSFNIIDGIYNTAETSAKLVLINSILTTKEAQYKELLTHNNSILKIKHDQKNFLLGILSQIDNKNFEKVRMLISKELDTLQNQSILPVNCNIVHTVVNYKQQIAAEHNIVIEHEYHDIQRICIEPTDLAIILGNALDNAIEATCKLTSDTNKCISLYIKVHGSQVVIVIKNPANKSVNTEKLISDKNSVYHGFGIMSMKNIATQYSGDVVFSTENNMFITYILLNNGINQAD